MHTKYLFNISERMKVSKFLSYNYKGTFRLDGVALQISGPIWGGLFTLSGILFYDIHMNQLDCNDIRCFQGQWKPS